MRLQLDFSCVEITHALVAVASQENCDGPEHDLMMEALGGVTGATQIQTFPSGESR